MTSHRGVQSGLEMKELRDLKDLTIHDVRDTVVCINRLSGIKQRERTLSIPSERVCARVCVRVCQKERERERSLLDQSRKVERRGGV